MPLASIAQRLNTGSRGHLKWQLCRVPKEQAVCDIVIDFTGTVPN
jgi:hypothetical protein